ncbi:MAG: hypothetical protein EON48_01055 [Acetobacteraceae bacterium]|nr:MAG: hypothetical protein EON48_01055 [Acetobacteraceae bacterium]
MTVLTDAQLREAVQFPELLELDTRDDIDWVKLLMSTGGPDSAHDRATLVWSLEREAKLGATFEDPGPSYARVATALANGGTPDDQTRLLYACAMAGWSEAQLRLGSAFAALAVDQQELALEVARRTPAGEPTPQLVARLRHRSETAATMAVGWSAVAAGRRATTRTDDTPLSVHARSLGVELFGAPAWAARDRYVSEDPVDEPEPRPGGSETHVLVLERIAGATTYAKDVAASVSGLVGKDVLLALAPGANEIRRIRCELVDAWPHAATIVDAILGDVVPTRPMRIRPTMVVGPPGAGKSRLLCALLDCLGIPTATLDAASCADHAITGSPRRWSHSYPSLPIATILGTSVANPALLLDEIEKAARSSAGSLHDPLLGLLERDTARRWRDQFLDAQVDVSWVQWCFTGNTTNGMPEPLLSRLRVLRMPSPGVEHVPALARTLWSDLLVERQLDRRLEPGLDAMELEAVSAAFAASKGASLRALRRIIEAALDARGMGWRN